MFNTEYSKILTKKFLIKEYIDNKKTPNQIAKQIGSSASPIRKKLKKYRIKTRTLKEALKGKFSGKNSSGYVDGRSMGKHYCQDCGIEVSNFTHKRCRKCQGKKHSKIMKGKLIGQKNGMFGKPVPHGKRIKYKGIAMRSSWEAKFAQFLDLSGYKWQYEPKRFYLGDCSYLPDFYLPDFDYYIEIKGYWRDNTKKRFELFKKKYSKINIKVLMKKDLESLGILEKR